MWLRIYHLWSCGHLPAQSSLSLLSCRVGGASRLRRPLARAPTVMLRALAVASGPVHAQRELGKPKGIQARVDVYGTNNRAQNQLATFYQSTRTCVHDRSF